MVRNVLFITGLQPWVTNADLKQLFSSSTLLHRDNPYSAHVCFDDDVTKLISQTNGHIFYPLLYTEAAAKIEVQLATLASS